MVRSTMNFCTHIFHMCDSKAQHGNNWVCHIRHDIKCIRFITKAEICITNDPKDLRCVAMSSTLYHWYARWSTRDWKLPSCSLDAVTLQAHRIITEIIPGINNLNTYRFNK